MTNRQIIDLEERSAFQERALEELNRVVATQQLELDRLVADVLELRSLLRGTGTSDGDASRSVLEDDRPPHY